MNINRNWIVKVAQQCLHIGNTILQTEFCICMYPFLFLRPETYYLENKERKKTAQDDQWLWYSCTRKDQKSNLNHKNSKLIMLFNRILNWSLNTPTKIRNPAVRRVPKACPIRPACPPIRRGSLQPFLWFLKPVTSFLHFYLSCLWTGS